MDCESCGRHRPSDQVVPARSITGDVVMVCGRCRRHMTSRAVVVHDLRPATTTSRPLTTLSQVPVPQWTRSGGPSDHAALKPRKYRITTLPS